MLRDHNSHSTLPTGPHRDAREVRSCDPQAPQGLWNQRAKGQTLYWMIFVIVVSIWWYTNLTLSDIPTCCGSYSIVLTWVCIWYMHVYARWCYTSPTSCMMGVSENAAVAMWLRGSQLICWWRKIRSYCITIRIYPLGMPVLPAAGSHHLEIVSPLWQIALFNHQSPSTSFSLWASTIAYLQSQILMEIMSRSSISGKSRHLHA